MEKKLTKSLTDRKLCGVCGGLAKYFGIDSNILRFIFILLALFGGGGVILYLLAALIFPNETTEDKEA